MRPLARLLAPLPVFAVLPTLMMAPAAHAADTTGQSTYIGGAGVGDGALATHAAVSGIDQGFRESAVDALGRVVFADSGANEIRRIDADGKIERIVGDGDYADLNGGFAGDGGPATQAKLAHPEGLVIASDGSMYIADSGNHRIRKVSTAGTISTIAGTGSDAPSSTTQPAATAAVSPSQLALGANGNLYFTENGATYTDVRVLRPDGNVALVAGNTSIDPLRSGCQTDQTKPAGQCFDGIWSVAVNNAGDVFVGTSHFVVYKISSGTMSIAAGTGAQGTSGDGGPATAATLDGDYGLTFAPDGTLLISTGGAVRGVDASGTITTYRAMPAGVIGPFALSGSDIINVTDRVTRVASDGTATELTGNLTDVIGDGLPAKDARFADISDISSLPNGSTLVGDRVGRVWTVDLAGIAHLAAGSTGGQAAFSGEGGTATAAVLPAVTAVAGAPDGSFYIGCADGTVRRVAGSGVITTVAGTGTPGLGADAVTAALAESIGAPRHLAVSSDGTVYILDSENARVRMLSGGNLQTVAGGGSTSGRSAAGGSATALDLAGVADAEPANDGGLLIVDSMWLYHVTGGTVSTVEMTTGNFSFAREDAAGALLAGASNQVDRIGADGSAETLSNLAEAPSGFPVYGFAGGGTFAWANDSQSGHGGFLSTRDRLWSLTVPSNTPRPPQVTGATYGADKDGMYVRWNQPLDPDLHVVPVLRDGTNQPAKTEWDGLDLENYPHAGSTHAAAITVGETANQEGGTPVTVSLFTVRMSTQVVSAPIVISWTPRYFMTCQVTTSARTVRYGAGTTITGTLASGPAAPTSNQPAALTARAANGHVTTLLRANTSSTGTLSVGNKPAMNTTYTMSHPANFFMACASSVAVTVQSAMKASLASTRILHGRTTTLTVVVGPNQARQYVTLQKYSGGRWVNVSTLKLGSTSKARWTVGAKTARKISYRVRKLADRYHVLSYSPKVVLTVR